MNTAERELIHRELDGENSEAESRRLHDLLAADSEARQLFEELSTVDDQLRETEMVEPPVWLKRSIMDALPSPSRRRSGIADFFGGLLETLQARPALAYAYTFVIGLVAGLGLFAIALGDAPATNGEISATLADREDLERLEPASATPIQLPGLVGAIEILTSRELVAIDLTLDAEEPVALRLVPEPSLVLRGVTRKSGVAASLLNVDEGEVHLDIRGAQSYTLLFDRTDVDTSELRLQIHREGRLIHEERLRTD